LDPEGKGGDLLGVLGEKGGRPKVTSVGGEGRANRSWRKEAEKKREEKRSPSSEKKVGSRRALRVKEEQFRYT